MEIVAAGCSFTFQNTDSIFWPDILGKDLNVTCKNLGIPGAGNDLIVSTVVDYVYDNFNNIRGVYILWSEWTRISLFNHPSGRVMFPSHHDQSNEKNIIGEIFRFLCQQSNWQTQTNVPTSTVLNSIIKYNIQIFSYLEMILDRFKIPLYTLQGLPPFPKHNQKFVDVFNMHDYTIAQSIGLYENRFNNEEFYGWPYIPSLGGINYWDSMHNTKYSTDDGHPNNQGHVAIANKFLEVYESI